MEAFYAAVGGEIVEVVVRDPLMRHLTARYLLHDRLAVIENCTSQWSYAAIEEERNPLVAATMVLVSWWRMQVRRGAQHHRGTGR